MKEANIYSKNNTTNAQGEAAIIVRKRGDGDITINATVNGVTGTCKNGIGKSAVYEKKFQITVYYTPKESECSGALAVANGLKSRHKKDFLSAVMMEGFGYTSNGTCIGYENGKYYSASKPLSSSGTGLKAGKTVAVKNTYIPCYNNNGNWKRATMSIDGVPGYRCAEDCGSAINGYHIDIYAGVGRDAYRDLENKIKNYADVTYYGNNINKW